MERSVVLEGKFAAEEPRSSEPAAVTPLSEAPAVPEKTAETVKNDSKDEAPTVYVAPADTTEAEATTAAAAKSEEEESKDEKVPAEPKAGTQVPEAQEKDGAKAETEADAENENEIEQDKANDEEAKESEATGSDDEDGFADAISSPSASKAKETDDKDVEEDKLDDGDETPLARSVAKLEEQAEKLDIETKDQASQETGAADGTDAAQKEPEDTSGADKADGVAAAKAQAPPPVLRRLAARGSGTTSPAPTSLAPPPTLPPRRARSPAVPAPVVAAPVPPKKLTLALTGDDTLEWEDKMWTEITKLKEELWKARIGLLSGEAGKA